MASKKHFLQDRAALLLVSGNAFLAAVSIILVSLRLNATQGVSVYIVGYRPSLGIGGAYIRGTIWGILSFVFFTALVLIGGIILSYRIYAIKRELALTVLALTIPLFLFLIVVANALLVLHQ
ncbi:MAG: hypothetical protein WC498_03045 [Candidatus Saccharimonadales bacterium]